MLRLLVAIVALVSMVALGSGPAHAGEPGLVRAMTFNIRYDTATDGDNAWPRRRQAVTTFIAFYAPDLLGLQEALPHQRDELEADLPGYEIFGVGRDNGADAGEMAPLAFRKDRFALVERGSFYLSPTP